MNSTPPLNPNPPNVIEGYQPEWSPWLRQFMTICLVIATVFGLTLLTPVLQILITTFLLAFLMYVPARMLAYQTPLRFGGAVVVCYLVLIAVIILAVVILIPNVIDFLNSIVTSLPQLQERATTILQDLKPEQLIIPVINLDLNPLIEPVRNFVLGTGTNVPSAPTPVTQALSETAFDIGAVVRITTNTLGSLVGTIGNFFSTSFLAIFLSLLVLLDLPNYQARLFESVPYAYQREARILLQRVGNVWRGFFRGQVTLGVIIGVLTAIQLTLMGVRQPVIIALIVAIISLIPSIGGFISLIPLAIVPLLFGSSVFEMSNFSFMLLVVGVNLVWTQIIWNVVAPKIMGEAVALPLPVIIIGIFIGTALGGVLGAFLIVPIAGSIRVFLVYIISKIRLADPFPGESTPEIEQLSAL
jgi:predicted PurR-regulated permease PerM